MDEAYGTGPCPFCGYACDYHSEDCQCRDAWEVSIPGRACDGCHRCPRVGPDALAAADKEQRRRDGAVLLGAVLALPEDWWHDDGSARDCTVCGRWLRDGVWHRDWCTVPAIEEIRAKYRTDTEEAS